MPSPTQTRNPILDNLTRLFPLEQNKCVNQQMEQPAAAASVF